MASPPQANNDDFFAAVRLDFDPTPNPLKDAAQAYCNQIRNSPEGWRLCLQKLHEVAPMRGVDPIDYIKFFCLQVIDEITGKRYASMNEEQKVVLRRSLMLFVRDIIPAFPQSSLIKNKLCVIFVKIIKHDYPRYWPSFFSDFLGLLDKGVEVIDVFIRLLKILDEDVVDMIADQGLAVQERVHHTAIKDSMRENDLGHIVDAMYSICNLYHVSHPGLVASALESFSDYIAWIDIQYVATERFLTLLYSFMAPPNAGTAASGANKILTPASSSPALNPASSPSRTASANSTAYTAAVIQLQIFASDCVNGIILKRMEDKYKKLALIKQLRILDFLSNALLPTHVNPLFPQDPSQSSRPFAQTSVDKFMSAIACIVESVGSELIEVVEKLNKLSNPDAKMQAQLNPQQLQQQVTDARNALTEALPMLEAALVLGYRFFEHPLFTVSEDIIELYGNFVELFKKAGPWTSMGTEHFKRIFHGLAQSMAYPYWYNFSNDDDDEQLFNDHRSKCQKLFTNCTLTNPNLLLELMAARLNETLQNITTVHYSKIEVTLKLFYEIALPLKANQKTHEEPFRSMLASLFSSQISAHPHPQISLIFFELVVRYVRFFEANPAFLPSVLSSFLDQRGLRNPNRQVRGRAAYLFNKCLTANELSKKQLRPFVDQALNQIQEVIDNVLGSNSSKEHALIGVDECFYLCECMGLLSSSAVTGTENVHRYVQMSLHFFRTQLEGAIQSQNSWYTVDQERAGLRLSQLIEGVSCITKQLGGDGSRVEDLMLEIAQLVLQILTILPTHAAVASKTIQFTHAMVDSHPHITAAQLAALATSPQPDPPILQYFSLVLNVVLKNCTSATITKITDLVIQIMIKFKKRFEKVLDAMFLPMCTKIFESLASFAHLDQPQLNSPTANGSSSHPLPAAAYSSERQDRLILQQRYYEFLKTIVANDLVSVFTSPTNARHIKNVLDTILAGCITPPDFSVHRACFTLLRHLVTIWSAQGVIAGDPAVKQFVMVEVTGQLFKSICAPQFANMGDPDCISAIRHLLELQRTIFKCLGEEYLNYVSMEVLHRFFGCPVDFSKSYCVLLMNYNTNNNQAGNEWKQFEPFFKAIQEQNKNRMNAAAPNLAPLR